MKLIGFVVLMFSVLFSVAVSQNRAFLVHTRGMLHETVFNTGEIGRAFDRGDAGISDGMPSMEWPPNSKMILNEKPYAGQHNSFGGGLWIAGTSHGVRQYVYCGAITTNNGGAQRVEGVYSYPISIDRTENYPVLADGTVNPAYNPNEAEEIITAKWGTPLGINVTRTSRAWSTPGYDSFIIFEYELENTDTVTVSDLFVVFPYGFCPSMFGYQRRYNRWAEGDYRQADQFARYDLKRWMTYNHDRIGKPEDSVYFKIWSTPGNRGGLNSPQAVGLLPLHYDYDHLAIKGQTSIYVELKDSVIWDENNKVKQPYLNRNENANLYNTKQQSWLDPSQTRKTGPFQGKTDSTGFWGFVSPTGTPGYWMGRAKPSWTLAWSQPVVHAYGFAPYTLPAGEKMHFSLAEVAGYGPGRASDSVYQDLGGGVRNEPAPGLHPVPSWYKALSYANVSTTGFPPYIGSDYLQTHPLPWYVDSNVVSIRDVADRAIQMYTGQPLVKYDTLQFEPRNTPEHGVYSGATLKFPVPAPAIKVANTQAAVNRISWGLQVETFNAANLHGHFMYYRALRANDPLGPWTLIDSVGKRDPRYFHDSVYSVYDTASTLGSNCYYSVVSVDSLGGKSGMTNMAGHVTQAPAIATLGKVYVVPNPLIVTNGISGESDLNGEVTDRLQFFGLTKHCTIRIFSYSGQLIQTIEHNEDSFGNPWYQISRNNQIVASGVYFFVVQDVSGAIAHGKFVIIH